MINIYSQHSVCSWRVDNSNRQCNVMAATVKAHKWPRPRPPPLPSKPSQPKASTSSGSKDGHDGHEGQAKARPTPRVPKQPQQAPPAEMLLQAAKPKVAAAATIKGTVGEKFKRLEMDKLTKQDHGQSSTWQKSDNQDFTKRNWIAFCGLAILFSDVPSACRLSCSAARRIVRASNLLRVRPSARPSVRL